jgi:hypothetical protein
MALVPVLIGWYLDNVAGSLFFAIDVIHAVGNLESRVKNVSDVRI